MKLLRILTVLVALTAGVVLVADRVDNPISIFWPSSSTTQLPEEFRQLEEVYSILRSNYVEPDKIDSKTLSEGAIRGMLDALNDPYTNYIESESYSLRLEDLRGSFGGIGAVVTQRESDIVIVRLLEGSPAASAGIQAGDVILKVDGVSIEGMSVQQVVLRIRGEEGTAVRLLVRRDGDEREIELVRSRISVESVSSRPLSSGIPYIQVSTFSDDTAQGLNEALRQIGLSSVPGLIIDVRDNTGGLLEAAVGVAGSFLDQDRVILYQRDRDGNETAHRTQEPGIAKDVPVAVLVNAVSASASEIFAGAIQAYDRGPLIGDRTFGKGSVGLLFNLSGGAGLSVTSARWLTPGHELIEGNGLTPDIQMEDDPTTKEDEQLQRAIDYILSQSHI